MDTTEQTPSEFYNSNTPDRTSYEDRAKVISSLTIPYLIRDTNDSGTTQMTDSNNQSYGGRLINTLTAKMGMALLPPSTSSFRFTPVAEELEAMTQGSPDNKAKVTTAISGATTQINTELETQQIRSSLFDIIRQLIGVGSVIVEKKKNKGILLHGLQSFVVKLNSSGEPVTMCIMEKLKVLPKDIVVKDVKDEYELYTMLKMDKETGRWTLTQDIDGELVGTGATYKDYDALPFRYLGWTWMKGDDYHRPYAEDYFKDLEQLNKLSKLLTDGSIISAKNLIFVNQRGGRTRKEDVADSENGDVIDGDAADVTTFKNEKNFDFQIVAQREQELKKELASAFLMNESVTRDAERVTAQEIRFMAQELESSSLAGIYSKLSLQWSKWIITQIMSELGIKFESINVDIVTGLDALGRSQEAQKLDSVLQRADALGLRHWYKDEEILARYNAYEGIDETNLMKTPNEVKQEMQQQKQAMAAQQADEAAAKAGGTAAGTNAGNAAVPPPEQQ
jgi:hypothetical protein